MPVHNPCSAHQEKTVEQRPGRGLGYPVFQVECPAQPLQDKVAPRREAQSGETARQSSGEPELMRNQRTYAEKEGEEKSKQPVDPQQHSEVLRKIFPVRCRAEDCHRLGHERLLQVDS